MPRSRARVRVEGTAAPGASLPSRIARRSASASPRRPVSGCQSRCTSQLKLDHESAIRLDHTRVPVRDNVNVMSKRIQLTSALPEAYKHLIGMHQAVEKAAAGAGLDQRLIELVKIRASQLN